MTSWSIKSTAVWFGVSITLLLVNLRSSVERLTNLLDFQRASSNLIYTATTFSTSQKSPSLDGTDLSTHKPVLDDWSHVPKTFKNAFVGRSFVVAIQSTTADQEHRTDEPARPTPHQNLLHRVEAEVPQSNSLT